MVLAPAFSFKVMVFALHVSVHKGAPHMPLALERGRATFSFGDGLPRKVVQLVDL